MQLAMRCAAVLLIVAPSYSMLAQVKPRPENGKLTETTKAKDAEVTIDVTDSKNKIIKTDRFPRKFGLGTENDNGPSITIPIPDKVGSLGGESVPVIDVRQTLKILKNSGEVSDLSIESTFFDPASGTFELVNIFGTPRTYRATYRMVEALRKEIPLTDGNIGSYMSFMAPQVEILIHKNPENKILHRMLVGEFNGLIRAMSDLDPARPRESWEKPLASLEGPRAYTGWIERPAPVFTNRVAASTLPPRPAGAPGGAEFMQSLAGLDRNARERAVLRELMSGNIPDFLCRLVPITVTATDGEGRKHTAVYQVMPDYLAIGSDRDSVRVPMNPHTAQAFCDAFGFVLPTPKMVDDIWREAISKIIPQPLTQSREDPLTFLTHNRMIEEQIAGQYRGELRAGYKKDVVITNRLNEKPNRIAIYGCHFPSGEPIQPLTTAHADWYVDYSHGIRPVEGTIKLDGADMPYGKVLRGPKLHVLLSNEGVMSVSSYASATTGAKNLAAPSSNDTAATQVRLHDSMSGLLQCTFAAGYVTGETADP